MCAKPANWTYPALADAPGSDPSVRAYVASPAIAREYDEYFAHSPLFRFDTQALTHWLPRPGRLLDLGCGTGRHLEHFVRRGWRVTGVDLSELMLAEAANKLAAWPGRSSLITANLTHLPKELTAGRFDAAICMFSTLGMIRPATARRTLCRHILDTLRPGGHLALHVHNRTHNWLSGEGRCGLLGSFLAAITGRREWGDKKLGTYRGIRGMIVHVFTRREIVALLEAGGFQVEEVLAINEPRNAPLHGRHARGLRANGYLILARKPAESFADLLSGHQKRKGI